jgi:putative FmdB family regulatory protein
MPIYEYRCEKCGDFEQIQRITEAALERCPTCRRKVTRLISNTSFQLKGSGWYVTDYARAGSGNGGNKGSESKSETSSSDGATESKPAKSEAKSESKSETSSTSSTGTAKTGS